MKSTPTEGCDRPDDNLLSVAEGRMRILGAVPVVSTSEQLQLRSALGRVLSEEVVAGIDVPPFANAAMDGYAVRSQDCTGQDSVTLAVVGTAFAGAPFEGRLPPGKCVRIMTGACIPEGADAVIMQEKVSPKGVRIRFEPKAVAAGDSVRLAGEDIRRGDTLLQAGCRLGPAEIGLLASVGLSKVSVRRRLRVAFFSTGDELVATGLPLRPGQIYDSNRYTLFGMLSHAGSENYDLGIVPDRREAVKDALIRAAGLADLILTSGGVSVGEADYVTETLRELGEINFWRLAMKPGKPLAFGRIGKVIFFGLPGNPVSVMATFYQFVLPAIRRMSGEEVREPLVFQARCTAELHKAPGRMEFQRGVLRKDVSGEWTVSVTGGQGSHVLSSMSRANCFILLPAESSGSHPGQLVDVQPFLDFCA